MASWVTDAQFFQDLKSDYIFKNARIEGFLRPGNYDQFLIVASKGMGKTLLIRYKRASIEDAKLGFLLIPQNETCDYVNLPTSPATDLLKSMKDSVFWEDLWKLSIIISCLLNFPHKLSEREANAVCQTLAKVPIPDPLLEELVAAFSGEFTNQRRPSSVLDILFQSGKRGIEKARSYAMGLLWDLFLKHIDSGCFVFIDSFDQELNRHFEKHLGIWCAAQCGLMRASWELSRQNRHVKIYSTIRQEAYASFDDSERANIRGSVLLIEYSKADLREIFTYGIRQYEGVQTISDFVGFDKIYNGYLRTTEDMFDYIYRHVIPVPRWLMTLGTEISASRPQRGMITDPDHRRDHQKTIAEIVNRVTSDIARDYLNSEMKLFFQGDNPDSFLANIVDKINSTVMSLSSVERASHRFVQEANEKSTEHPFCLLYNFGLLGMIEGEATSRGRVQVFKKPYQFNWNYEHILPLNPESCYLIHPCLHHIIQKRNYKFNFNQIRIGDGMWWTKRDDKVIRSETVKIFFSYAHDDWPIVDGIVEVAERYLSEKAIFHDLWLDRWKMRGGKWVQDQLLAGLETSDYLVLCISKNSLGSNSVATEWKSKFSEKLSSGRDTIFPFIIDDTDYSQLPGFLKHVYAYQYKGDEQKLIRLLEDVLFWRDEDLDGRARKRR